MEQKKPFVVSLLTVAIAFTAYGAKAGDQDKPTTPPMHMGEGSMPMMPGPQGGMPGYGYSGGIPMMQGRQGGMSMYGFPGGMPMGQGPYGGMPMMQDARWGMPIHHHPEGMAHHGLETQHLQQVEARLANIEALLRELVALQRSR